MTHPTCFDSDEQHVAWLQADKSSSVTRIYTSSSFCLDCTPDYAERMRTCGRCERPDVEFKRFHGELIGYVPADEDPDADMVGVHFHAARGKWVAKVWGKGRYRSLGYFDTKQEAKEERIKALMSKHSMEAA